MYGVCSAKLTSQGLLGDDSFWYTARNRFVFWCSGRREIANKKRGFLGKKEMVRSFARSMEAEGADFKRILKIMEDEQKVLRKKVKKS